MSRLHEELSKRAGRVSHTPEEAAILQRYEQRVEKFKKLMASSDFQEYLKLEAEMNDPRIVIAHKCTDPVCESMKTKIRDFWQRQRVLEKVSTHGTRPHR